ncbi:LuxR C-terminal-related transcriptional regulator [Streptomyces sp. NPDC001407]|uniref:helix-turn-helix transcriptional regulator n=1 Tax=Streptomyces sp. NPDC001407 TaxID=3364573 RepID=UPI0036986D46
MNESCESGNGCRIDGALCKRGVRYYLDAVRTGHADQPSTPACLLRLQLLQPVPGPEQFLTPIRPSAALAMLVRPIEQEIQQRQEVAQELQRALDPIEALYNAQQRPVSDLAMLEGLPAINAAIDLATKRCTTELLTSQPGGGRSSAVLSEALQRSRDLIARGVRLRTLYQHTVRYNPATMDYIHQITEAGDSAQVRTLDELFERLIIFDREVAFIPARSDRQSALEVRNPALITFLVDVYERAWQRAAPLTSGSRSREEPSVIPGIRRTICQLLVSGYVDEAIARRLGMSVRTCRSHIAKIAEQLGSTNRAQLGYLLATSGLLGEPAITDPE